VLVVAIVWSRRPTADERQDSALDQMAA
jgi:hypothetical protein